ncbi:MAG: tetratricopeptide repeat protein [Verrucomicrobiales bacterium]|nr:tetratricopeptide repeat protein [Verrucomicrobiales bacterium]
MKIKYHFAILFSALAMFASGISHAQQSLVAVHREGIALYNAGNYQEALIKFQQVLRAKPSYIHARVYSSKCQQAIKNGLGSKKNVSDSLSKVLIPAVDFQEVPLGDALTYISQRTQELTAGKIIPNIIFSGSAEQRSSLTVTMKLNQVPVTTLLKYVGSQTRCKIQYDEHAIMVTPFDNVPQTMATPQPAAPNPFQ